MPPIVEHLAEEKEPSSMPAKATDIRPAGRREANKREKLVRIRRAAREVFMRQGFEAATVREIAERADVAFGTLFLYAKDKRELLLLLFDDELDLLTERAMRCVGRNKPLVEQLIDFFEEFYRFFSKTPQLSRQMMTEITFTGGMVAQRIWAGVQNTERRLADLITEAQRVGAVAAGIQPERAAHILFSLYRTEIRFCLAAEGLDVRGSLANLRHQFEIVYAGLAQPPKGAGFRESRNSGKPPTRRPSERVIPLPRSSQ